MDSSYKFSSLFQYSSQRGVLVFFIWDKKYIIKCSQKNKKTLIQLFNTLLGSIFSEETCITLLDWLFGNPKEFFNFLLRVGIIIDLNNGVIHDIIGWANLSYNPSILTPLKKIWQPEHIRLVMDNQNRWSSDIIQWQKWVIFDFLENRKTIRGYIPQKTDEQELTYLFACLYWNIKKEMYQKKSIIHKTTPSWWAFWPLHIYFFRFTDWTKVLLEKYDWIDLIPVRTVNNKNELCEKMIIKNESLDFENAQGLIVILADLENMSKKYWVKSYQLALLEWGHISQNFVLASEEKGYGTCELWWVIESVVLSECGVDTEKYIFVNSILFWKK